MDTLNLGDVPEEGVLMGRLSKYSPEFPEQAVEMVRATGKTIAEVARDLQINDTALPKVSSLSSRCSAGPACCARTRFLRSVQSYAPWSR